MAYIGKSPAGLGVRARYFYTATGGETSLSGADDNGRVLQFTDGEYVDVYLNGVLLVAGTDYGTGTANTISGLDALSAGNIVEIVAYDIFSLGKANTEALRRRYYKTATGGETSISGSDDNGLTITFAANAEIEVYLNGVALVQGDDYNTSTANTVGGLSALDASDIVSIVVYEEFILGDVVSKKSGGTFGNSISVSGDLTVDTDTLVVDSTNNRVGVGTTSPSYNFDIQGATNGNVLHRIKNSTAGTSARAGIFLDADDGNKMAVYAISSAYTGVASWQDAGVISTSSPASGGLIMNGQGGDIKFQRALTEKARITSNGLTFNGDTAAANALNDYEEGTWTATTDQGTLSSSSTCKYVKVGNLVTVTGLVTNFSNRTATGGVIIRGLPFATGSTDIGIGAVLARFINATGDQTSLYFGTSRSHIAFYNMNQGTAYDQVRHADLNSTSANFHFTVSYRAA